VVEAYRALRTNIQVIALTRNLRILMLTGPTPHDGKSVTVANLAIVLAHAGRRVILVDADLHRPKQHQLFHVANKVGLTSFLDTSPDQETFQVKELLRPTSVPNLQLLPSGPLPQNPSELLSSSRMRQVLEQLKAETELVLIDTPPASAVVDAAVLATQVDGVLFVLRANKTEWKDAKGALDLLQQVNAPIIGTILNAVSKSQSLYAHHDYGYGLYRPDKSAAPTLDTSLHLTKEKTGVRTPFALLGKRTAPPVDLPTNGHAKAQEKEE
jgi:capsular exopolysaccharide synthesis family protein